MAIRKRLKKSQPAPKVRDETDEGRREAVKKLGIYGAYTAPALVALLQSGKAAAGSFVGG